ncbi:hypothetical protein GCM10007079_21630 [Nocardiopsis terrae]|uniref:YrhK domain-containing protein n=1 Tax=Nocardiopsis terrae TaxID=372655 RepID=A0ABR9HGS0_9ACTN|nr:YrhK family protein [Nocardiopsis terrae]MBE1458225.1 hypothetical protein [Nocardiopsis terrae]GHC81545.1 hypothetical protein GCM10007079_21630 [Nocardiopsis terrae]
MSDPESNRPLTVHIGHEELVVRQRYEALSILNDILIALWFIAGSIMFFFPEWTVAGTWCFLAGSVELLIRPLIRLGRQVNLSRVRARTRPSGMPPEAPLDF